MPRWNVGDPVFARYYDSRTQRYFVKGHGRVLRIEGDTIVMRTRAGEEHAHVSTVGLWRSKEEAEAAIALDPSPQQQAGPMAHHTAPVQVEPVDHECLRCERLLDGLEPLVPDHTPRCPYRGTGRDPEPRG